MLSCKESNTIKIQNRNGAARYVCSPRWSRMNYAARLGTISGCSSAMRNKHCTPPRGENRPCSQSCTVAIGVLISSANFACDKPSFLRAARRSLVKILGGLVVGAPRLLRLLLQYFQFQFCSWFLPHSLFAMRMSWNG